MRSASPWLNIVLSAGVGAVFGFLGTIVRDILHDRNQKKSLNAAIQAEIETVLELIKVRGYESRLAYLLELVEKGPLPDGLVFSKIGQNYFNVYETNAGRIGDLPPDLSGKVVEFYMLAKGLLEDLNNATMLFSNPDGIKEDMVLLRRLVETGEEIVARLKK